MDLIAGVGQPLRDDLRVAADAADDRRALARDDLPGHGRRLRCAKRRLNVLQPGFEKRWRTSSGASVAR